MQTLAQIGEFGLIERFRKRIKTDSTVIKGSGDDCAVLKFTADKYLLFTCDMITEGADFTAKDKPSLIGRKALGVSISDIAACGGIPRHAVVSLGAPKNSSLKYIDEITRGLFGLARTYKINIVGGDLSRTSRLTIDVSVLGVVEKRNLLLRSGAEKGDLILVSGPLGGSILGKHLTFKPRLEEARFLAGNFKINSMIDISDGLAQDLSHILTASHKGGVLFEELIPLSENARNLGDALYAGEDFELLFTATFKEAKKILANKKFRFKIIGEVVDKAYGLRLIDKRNRQVTIPAKGYRHF